jgi:hypothetical protein
VRRSQAGLVGEDDGLEPVAEPEPSQVPGPNGARGISADLAAGARLPALLWVSTVLLALGLLLGGGAAALIYFGAREPRIPMTPAA